MYSYLCLDGHLQSINTTKPCIWVSQPWPAIAAKREYASIVQIVLEDLNHNNESSWQSALLNVLETYHANIQQLDNTIPINDYLEQAIGFTSAYSFPSCNPPRAIVYCTTSLVELMKCTWLQEVANVYGIEPSLQCIRETNLNDCMESVEHNASDVVFVNENERIRSERVYKLKPILYEYAKQKSDRYTVVAVVKNSSEIYNFNDLYKKRACFPNFEGSAYLSVLETIRNKIDATDENESYLSNEVNDYFADDSCFWASNSAKCKEEYAGDDGALKCLHDNRGDVAFVEMAAFERFISMTTIKNPSTNEKINLNSDYKLICPFGREQKSNELCYLHWTSRGFLMINNQTKTLRKNEIYNAIRDMDRLFGKYYESHVLPFAMYGPFDKFPDIMFHDQTEALRGIVEMQHDQIPRFLEPTIDHYMKFEQQRLEGAHNSVTTQRIDSICLFVVGILMILHFNFFLG